MGLILLSHLCLGQKIISCSLWLREAHLGAMNHVTPEETLNYGRSIGGASFASCERKCAATSCDFRNI